jgi:CheY-like chemotaxis protein/nitrogen-specific signal transduction histidine kinase/HPt (histidine-containing phosphotransfer) domain-containing protein
MIAEMKKAEIAEESSKAKSDFLAKMSHEIRTPMNAILGITEIQLQDESHQQGTKEAFERIYNSGDLLLHIINDILDLSKIEAGKLVLVPGEYDIASLINDTIQLVMMRYESKPIDFKLNVSEDIPLTLLGDELRIKQILNNILSNAFKYTEEGEIRFSIFCETKTPVIHDGGEKSTIPLVFVVSDTGQGMTADQVHKLGTEYSRFNMEANRKTEGTGLGMNITRNLIQLMGGDLSIESAPGKGSTFTVRLPQKHLGSSVIGKEVADNLMELNHDNTRKLRTLQMKRDFMPYGRVLVVDDVETNLYVAKGMLAPYGLSVDTVISGFEAVDKIRDGGIYDVIFMDHMMPRMDGIEATKIIRSLGYNRPIVALTANALAGQAEMFLENGFDDFISKPIDIRQLNVVLNKLIRDLQPPEVVEQARKQKESKHFKKQKPVEPQLAEFFIKDAKKTMTVLEAIYINKCRRVDDISMFIINTHAMKSALANIGETDVSSEAAKLEQAGRDNDIKKILSGLPAFLELLRDVIERLKPDENNAETGGVYEEYSYLIEKLAVLDKACEALDKKTSKKTLAEIREKDWPNNIKEQLAGIAEQLLHSDFEEACKIINGIMKRF